MGSSAVPFAGSKLVLHVKSGRSVAVNQSISLVVFAEEGLKLYCGSAANSVDVKIGTSASARRRLTEADWSSVDFSAQVGRGCDNNGGCSGHGTCDYCSQVRRVSSGGDARAVVPVPGARNPRGTKPRC